MLISQVPNLGELQFLASNGWKFTFALSIPRSMGRGGARFLIGRFSKNIQLNIQ